MNNQEITYKNIYFRADGNNRIGLGHIIRSLALANMLRSDFSIHFLVQNPDAYLIQLFQEEAITLSILPETSEYLKEAENISEKLISGEFIVLDGYNFDTTYQKTLKKAGLKVICLDDIHAFPFMADAIINQAGGLKKEQYISAEKTLFCLGPEYALLRKPFLEAALLERDIIQVTKIFINFGGSDPDNYTLNILTELIKNFTSLKFEVVVGSAYAFAKELTLLIQRFPQINLHQNLTATAMCRLMQTCDAGILPPSSVSYEWCSVGGPLFIQQTAKNQSDMASFLINQNLALPLTELPDFLNAFDIAEKISTQIKNQRIYFNGKSPQKLKKLFSQLDLQDNMQLKPALEVDMLQLFNWANDPVVRHNSFNPEPISLESHKTWFINKLKDSNCLLLLGYISDMPAGMIRFEIKDKIATINYLVDKAYRGKGAGTILLQKGIEKLKQIFPEIIKTAGFVQIKNRASVNAFLQAGFKNVSVGSENIDNVLTFEIDFTEDKLFVTG